MLFYPQSFNKKKFDLSSNLSQFFASTPLNLFPMAVAKLQPPIIKAVKRKGDYFDTMDKPIGLKNNSPMVITPYEPINHQALAL